MTKQVVLVEGLRGQYVPQSFARSYAKDWILDPDDVDILLEGPGHEEYWDAWVRVERDAFRVDSKRQRWELLHDEDLFAVCHSEDLKEFLQ